MKGSVFPGDTMTLSGVVSDVSVDAVGCGFVTIDVSLSVDDDVKTTCTARVALPVGTFDNPWARRGAQWRPAPAAS
jgi:hypothetical protein